MEHFPKVFWCRKSKFFGITSSIHVAFNWSNQSKFIDEPLALRLNSCQKVFLWVFKNRILLGKFHPVRRFRNTTRFQFASSGKSFRYNMSKSARSIFASCYRHHLLPFENRSCEKSKVAELCVLFDRKKGINYEI